METEYIKFAQNMLNQSKQFKNEWKIKLRTKIYGIRLLYTAAKSIEMLPSNKSRQKGIFQSHNISPKINK